MSTPPADSPAPGGASRRKVAVLLAVALAATTTGGVAFATSAQSALELKLINDSSGTLNAVSLKTAKVSVDTVKGATRPTTLLIDGEEVASTDGSSAIVHSLAGLKDGKHTIVAQSPGSFPRRGAKAELEIEVDTTPPKVDISVPEKAALNDAVTVTGKVSGGKIDITEGGGVLKVNSDGTFEVKYEAPPANAKLVAVDAAGNETEVVVDVPVLHPGMRAVHMSALSWTSKTLREPILQLVKDGKIDTIQLDIKDENGEVGFKSTNELANKIGAVKGYYDAKKAIDELHALDVKVVGRIVAFRDPILAQWAWRNGKRDMVIQDRSGNLYTGKYNGFGNFANPEVRQYNIDLAVEAAGYGFDDILYDYIRRPDGSVDKFRFPGIKGTPEAEIANFCKESREALRPLGVFVGASVYGIAADRPTQIAQDIPAMSKYLDYVAPMVYPSHWAPGEYGVSNPNAMPGPIVEKSLALFNKATAGTDAKVIPWLQDFSMGVRYGPAEVRAQIDAAKRVGIDSFILWNAGVRYTGAALEVKKK